MTTVRTICVTLAASTVALICCYGGLGTAAFSAPQKSASSKTLATQGDLAKMWKVGGVTVAPNVPVTGEPFKTAVAFTSPKKGANAWSAQVGEHPTAAITAGDVLLATFYARATKPATGNVVFDVADAGPKYTPSTYTTIQPTGKWKKYSIPFASKDSYGPGKWQVAFHLGNAAQTVQIGGFSLVDYGKSKSVDSLLKSM